VGGHGLCLPDAGAQHGRAQGGGLRYLCRHMVVVVVVCVCVCVCVCEEVCKRNNDVKLLEGGSVRCFGLRRAPIDADDAELWQGVAAGPQALCKCLLRKVCVKRVVGWKEGSPAARRGGPPASSPTRCVLY